jgi:hypothetical protein
MTEGEREENKERKERNQRRERKENKGERGRQGRGRPSRNRGHTATLSDPATEEEVAAAGAAVARVGQAV